MPWTSLRMHGESIHGTRRVFLAWGDHLRQPYLVVWEINFGDHPWHDSDYHESNPDHVRKIFITPDYSLRTKEE